MLHRGVTPPNNNPDSPYYQPPHDVRRPSSPPYPRGHREPPPPTDRYRSPPHEGRIDTRVERPASPYDDPRHPSFLPSQHQQQHTFQAKLQPQPGPPSQPSRRYDPRLDEGPPQGPAPGSRPRDASWGESDRERHEMGSQLHRNQGELSSPEVSSLNGGRRRVELVSGNGGPATDAHRSEPPESSDQSAPPQPPHGGSLISIQAEPAKERSRRGAREKEERGTKDKRNRKSTTRRGKEDSVSSSTVSGAPSREDSAVYVSGRRGRLVAPSPAPLKESVTRSSHGTYSQYSHPGL